MKKIKGLEKERKKVLDDRGIGVIEILSKYSHTFEIMRTKWLKTQ